jgi:hypothetical protein
LRRMRNAVVALVVAMLFASPGLTQTPDAVKQGKDLLKGLGGSKAVTTAGLSAADMSGGLRDALRVGSERVVVALGKADGFNKSADVRIPLPGTLKTAQCLLSKVGLGGMADDVEVKLNRAAEAAVPEAKALFVDAISQMSIDDAAKIVNGPKDSATQYFRQKMSPALVSSFTPIVDKQLASVGAVASLDKMMGQYKSIPMAPRVQTNLTSYVVEKAMDGVFIYLAKEEAAIRDNPAARSTELLKKVFGK